MWIIGKGITWPYLGEAGLQGCHDVCDVGDEELAEGSGAAVSGQREQHSIHHGQQHGMHRNVSIAERLVDGRE